MIVADTASAGLVWGSILFGLVAVLCLLWIGYFFFNQNYDTGGFIISGVVVLLIDIAVFAVAMWPYKYDYHHWVDVSGRVDRVSSRLVSAGDQGGSNQRFVVVINGQPYGVDDTRASLVKPGDKIALRCKKEYEWGSSSNGWGCRWNGPVPGLG